MAAVLSSTLMPMLLILLCLSRFKLGFAKPEQGVWDFTAKKDNTLFSATKSMFKNSQLSISILCESSSDVSFNVTWIFRRSPCANEYTDLNETVAEYYLQRPFVQSLNFLKTEYLNGSGTYTCSKNKQFTLHPVNDTNPHEKIYPPPTTKSPKPADSAPSSGEGKKPDAPTSPKESAGGARKRRAADGEQKEKKEELQGSADKDKKKPAEGAETNSEGTETLKQENPAEATKQNDKETNIANSKPHQIDHESQQLLKTWQDGYFLLVIQFSPSDPEKKELPADFELQAKVRMSNGDSYLAAVDRPLLIFYGVMGLVYIGFGIMWLVMLACNWRDLLRVQFWIGGVILLGMLEKAVFFAEYENINNTGQSVKGAIIFAELVSCLKRSLARMLVIIVSLGYGIVKPRLGQTFHKVLIVGVVFFILASIEGCMRALAEKADQSKQQLLPGVPLAVTDAIICWWIFSSLLQTTRTLRLRRNIVKLSLYRHFTNTLIFSVIASVAYMIWFLTQHRFKECLSDWKELWMDDAYWHLLFSVLLFVIMILWRPTVNNQRYAFSPLLDAAEDDIDDDTVLSEAYEGMKMRTSSKSQQRNGSTKGNEEQKNEDDLRWVEDNIPASFADKVLPALDSDEEIMNTKFEVSKME
ncbi:unnamed protein product [Lymnaea stagnalis]|uniref:Transmembrane protein 87A n=1 Tax=Lymnaea stagnalis TaxID=6523 RepID=A0AAV2HDD1_LYMST